MLDFASAYPHLTVTAWRPGRFVHLITQHRDFNRMQGMIIPDVSLLAQRIQKRAFWEIADFGK